MPRKIPLLILVAASTLTACTPPEPAVRFFNEKLGPLLGVQLQSAKPAKPAPTGQAEAEKPDHRLINGEFIKELFKVVLRRDLVDEEEFMKYMSILDQGGHYDGIYNGIVYSSEYREREKGAARPGAIRLYAEVVSQLTLDQRYDPLKIKNPDVSEAGEEQGIVPPQPTEVEKTALVAEFEKEALSKPFYTLKRRMGEEVLKTIELKKEYREKLATWYGRFTVQLNKKGMDFGIAARNRQSEYYHYQWALEADEERIKWECLNRVHMLMNAEAN